MTTVIQVTAERENNSTTTNRPNSQTQLPQTHICEDEATTSHVCIDSSQNGTIVSTCFKALYIHYHLIFLTVQCVIC